MVKSHQKKDFTQTIIMTAETISLMPLPVKKPRKEKRADLKTLFMSDESWMSSPTKAPTKGPAIIVHTEPMKSPAKHPIVDPMVPALDPPEALVSIPGTKTFRISTIRVRIPSMMMGSHDTELSEVKWARRRAPQHRGVPGKPGIMHPIRPTTIRRTPMAIKATSFTSMDLSIQKNLTSDNIDGIIHLKKKGVDRRII